ncbi:unnamed protein product [Phytophthora lilii]|uniref:Unnamed protein product n=1 Tax=Phytophthora lilii TaxID=2077276 RepID=A0A9W6TNN9_9STRA|nr:unnamed protein product [Phytophthora lilii]
MSLKLNGKTIVSMADYKLFWNNIRAQTGYSPQRILEHCSFLFIVWTSNPPGGATIANDGLVKRLLSNPPTAGADLTSTWPSIGGTSASTTIANQTASGAFVAGAATANAIMGTWNYMLKIKLVDLYPIFKGLDLMANPQTRIRFRVNQGFSVVAVDSGKGTSLTSNTLHPTGSFASAAVQEFQSPFDSAAWTLQPGSSICNFNVRIGSTQCFDISHDYDFHHSPTRLPRLAL